MSDNRGSEIIGAFVVGGIIGAILGVLYAPAKGAETREKLNDWMDETKEKTKDTIEKLEAELKKRKEHLMKHVN